MRHDAAANPAAAPLGLAAALAVLAGTSLCQLLPELAPRWVSAALMIAALLLSWRWPRLRLPALLAFGFGYAMLRGDCALSLRLAPEFEGRELALSGVVHGFPSRSGEAVRFEFEPESAESEGRTVRLDGRLRLAWYSAEWVPEPGQRLQLVALLKRPHGAANPGGFDFERQTLLQRIAATGYLRGPPTRLDSSGAGLEHWRWRFAAALAAPDADPSAAGLLAALAVGDESAIPDADWDVLRATGTTHLVSISGSHIAAVAGLGALLARALFWIWPTLGLRFPRARFAALVALAFASGYALLAGWSVPVERSVVMVGVVALAQLSARTAAPGQALGLALWAVLLLDPLGVLSPGFWLSFVGVAWLLWCLSGRLRPESLLVGFGRAQLAVGIGLLPLGIWFFQQASLVAPLANAFAIPWVTLVVTPLALLLAAVFGLAPDLLPWCLKLAEPAARFSLWVLTWLADLPGANHAISEPSLPALLLALLGAAAMLMPRGVAVRALGALLIVPLLLTPGTAPASGSFELAMLDVGQGLSVLVRTAHHDLLYDAGPAMPNGLDFGEAVVAPALTAFGVSGLDRLVVSHRDNDHAGGAPSVIRRLHPAQIQRSDAAGGPTCIAGESWEWDGVRFEYLHPPADFPYRGNASCCVLKVSAGSHAALLPGDIQELTESRLVREQSAALAAELLVAPHHGSRGSSTPAFLAATNPAQILISAGYRSRFGHPHSETVARYRDLGARWWNTADFGMLQVAVTPDGASSPLGFRSLHPRYWRAAPPVTQ